MPVDSVVKLGGGALAHPEAFRAALDAIAAAATTQRLLVVPGGGPFADTVRAVDEQMHLSDDAAHWMAILAMDQYAYLVADRLAGAVIVGDRATVDVALDAGRIPVLAPSAWVRGADPLPHSWDVTGDSIAAWVAGVLEARRLVLIKPPGSPGSAGDVVDRYFTRALPPGLTVVTIAADELDQYPNLR